MICIIIDEYSSVKKNVSWQGHMEETREYESNACQ